MVQNEGQKTVRFLTRDHEARELTFQCPDVNKILACVSGITDAENVVMFGSTGGHILKLDAETKAAVDKLISGCKTKTAFERRGNVYVMDAYVKVAPGSKLAQQIDSLRKKKAGDEGFHRPEKM